MNFSKVYVTDFQALLLESICLVMRAKASSLTSNISMRKQDSMDLDWLSIVPKLTTKKKPSRGWSSWTVAIVLDMEHSLMVSLIKFYGCVMKSSNFLSLISQKIRVKFGEYSNRKIFQLKSVWHRMFYASLLRAMKLIIFNVWWRQDILWRFA